MATSQNGWPVIESGSSPLLVASRWVTGKVRAGDVATVFDYLAARFNAEVEPIRKAESWGYANRDIRGSATTSNHASGTAEDYNAPSHPLGAVGTFTAGQRAAIARIVADLGGVVRWGGHYAGRKDEMHFELIAAPSAVRVVANRIRSGQLVSNVRPVGGSITGGVSVTAPAPLVPEEDIVATRAELQADIAAAIAPVAQAVANLTTITGRARWYKIEGTTLAWLDLGSCRRRGTAEQYAADPSGVVALKVNDPFWRVPIVGPAWGGEAYRKPGTTAAWFPNLVSGVLVRQYPGRQGYIDVGAPPILDLPESHPFWNLLTEGPLPGAGD